MLIYYIVWYHFMRTDATNKDHEKHVFMLGKSKLPLLKRELNKSQNHSSCFALEPTVRVWQEMKLKWKLCDCLMHAKIELNDFF